MAGMCHIAIPRTGTRDHGDRYFVSQSIVLAVEPTHNRRVLVRLYSLPCYAPWEGGQGARTLGTAA